LAIERLTDFVNYAYFAFFSLFHGQYLQVLAITFVRDIMGKKQFHLVKKIAYTQIVAACHKYWLST